MGDSEQVKRVWIASGCTACGACAGLCPEVFRIEGTSAVVTAAAQEAEFVAARSAIILTAADACPAGVIRVETGAATPETGADATCATEGRAATSGDEPGAADGQAAAEASPDGETADGADVSRRGLLSSAGVTWLALGGTACLSALGLQRFAFPRVAEQEPHDMPLGPLAELAALPVGSVIEPVEAPTLAVIRLEDGIAALSRTCTHLGCLTRWSEADRMFKCPCHGSTFRPNGTTLAGPAPRALERVAVRIEDGQVVADPDKRFRRERGEWAAPGSHVALGEETSDHTG